MIQIPQLILQSITLGSWLPLQKSTVSTDIDNSAVLPHPSEKKTKVSFIMLESGDRLGPAAVNERSSSLRLGDKQELRR